MKMKPDPKPQPQYQRYSNIILNKSQPLGSGNFGHVYRGYLITPEHTLQPVAIKQSYNESSSQNIKEIQTLQILHHPNIVRYRDYRISGNSVFMVMELCEGGTLDDLLYGLYVQAQGCDTQKLLGYYKQIVSGIRFMYEKKILHRDIKPSNLLVSKSGVIKIADFGTSKMDRSSQIKLKTLVGTPLFFSPELFEMSFGQQDTYTEKSEIWALGLILYYMFNYQYTLAKPNQRMKESLPWAGKSTVEIFKNIKSTPLKFKRQEQIPEQIKDIIRKMLKIDVNQRMSFSQLFSLQLFSSPPSSNPSSTLQPTPQTEQKTLIQTTRQTIDWQLLQLLQQKDQQNINSQELHEFRLFYELLVSELEEIYEIRHYEIMFELEFMWYQVCQDQGERGRLREKYYERGARFEEIEEKIRSMETGFGNPSQNPSIVGIGNNKSGMINLQGSEPNQLLLPLPSQKLISLAKSLMKQLLPLIDLTPSPKKLQKSPSSLLSGSQKQKKNIIYLVYDLFTLITFQKSWQIKRKTRATMLEYKKMRALAKIGSIVGRVAKAVQCVKI